MFRVDGTCFCAIAITDKDKAVKRRQSSPERKKEKKKKLKKLVYGTGSRVEGKACGTRAGGI